MQKIKKFIIGCIIGVFIALLLNINLVLDIYSKLSFILNDTYKYNAVRNHAVIYIDKRVKKKFILIKDLIILMNDPKLKASKLVDIEDISIGKLNFNTLGKTIFWKDLSGNKRVRIILNEDILDNPYLTFCVLLHEIGHAAYKFDHYEKEYDLMNSKSDYVDSKAKCEYLIAGFFYNSEKYEKLVE